MTTRLCTLEDCNRPYSCKGLCHTHYARLVRTGSVDLAPRYIDVTGQRYGTLVVTHRERNGWRCLCDCGGTRWVETEKELRLPQRVTCGDWKAHPTLRDDVTYTAVHHRLRIARGPARTHSCIDCGHPAGEWSYNHSDPDELEGPNGDFLSAYSTDPTYYDPRCISCHRSFDRSRELVSA